VIGFFGYTSKVLNTGKFVGEQDFRKEEDIASFYSIKCLYGIFKNKVYAGNDEVWQA